MSARHSIACFVLLAALAACTPSPKAPEPVEGPVHKPVKTSVPEPVEEPTPELSAIDSLMWQHPDSALQCLLARRDAMIASPDTVGSNLRRIQCVSTTTFDDHYANLLLAELLYKNDYAQTNRAELLRAVGYFDSLLLVADGADTRGVSLQPRRRRDARRATAQNRAFLDARAHYINGVGYYEKDSVVEACKEYLKALEVMEGCFEEEELIGKKAKFMALTYTHLTGLFSNLYLHEQAIYFGKKSLTYYEKYEAFFRHVAWMLNKIGSHYDMMNNYDSAEFYYNEGLKTLSDTNNLTFRDLSTRLAYLSYTKGKSTETALSQLHTLINQSENEEESLSRYAIIGEIFYQEKQFDSAWLYFKKVFQASHSIDSKKQIAERLVEICKTQGKEEEILEYAGFLVPFATQDEDNGFIKSRLAELYNIYKQHELEHQHRKKAIKQTRWSVGIVIGLLFVTMGVFVLYRKHKRKKQSLEEQIKMEQYIHEIKQKALAGKLKQSNETLRDVSKQLEQSMANNALLDVSGDPDDYSAYINTPICQYLIKLVHEQQFKSKMDCMIYKDSALSKEQLLALHDAAEKKLPRFTSHVRQQFSGLTDGDMDYCYLLLLGLNEADISALMQRAYSTVCERSRKINRIIEAKGDLYHTLRNMLSD